MSLGFDDRWIWDFWLVDDGPDHHVFYLQAPTALGDPGLRHWHASIGHAVSSDLTDWEVLPDALGPGAEGTWDDYSTWTGSIVSHADRWHLLYTGTSRAEDGRIQRIGRAVSDDLIHWERSDDTPVEADRRWYEDWISGDWHDEAWRDPWVFWDPADEAFHAYVTARVRTGPADERGVVGHLRSPDLGEWEALAPVTQPMGFGQMEVPQLVTIGGRWYLIFCSDIETQSEQRRRRGTGTGTYYLMGESPYGPFHPAGTGVLESDSHGSTYAGKIHHTSSGEPVFLAWHRHRPDGRFLGTISAPRPVQAACDGTLRVR